jgi:hypothetical protein
MKKFIIVFTSFIIFFMCIGATTSMYQITVYTKPNIAKKITSREWPDAINTVIDGATYDCDNEGCTIQAKALCTSARAFAIATKVASFPTYIVVISMGKEPTPTVSPTATRTP